MIYCDSWLIKFRFRATQEGQIFQIILTSMIILQALAKRDTIALFGA